MAVKISILAACIEIAVAHSVPGATSYHVAVGGDGNGSAASPLGSISEFDAIASAGDTCWVHGGTYTPSETILLTKDGSDGRPICLFAWPGEIPVIDGGNATDEAAIKMRNTDWWHVRGLEVTNTQGEWIAGVMTTGTVSHITFELMITHHNRFVGLLISGTASDILVVNCDSHHNVDSDYEDADGFQIYPSVHSRIVYRGCRAWNNADDGWDFYFATEGSVYMENCWAFRNGYSDQGASLGNGNGFKLGGGTSDSRAQTSGGHKVVRCIAFGNKYCGFNENTDTGAEPDTLYNNIGYDNAGWADYDFDCGLVHVLRNNISFGGNGAAVGPSVNDHNSWNAGLSVSAADFASVDPGGADGDRQADGSLPDLLFLKPEQGGRCIDNGVDVGLEFYGRAPDLGTYEYRSATGAEATGMRKAPMTDPTNHRFRFFPNGRRLPGGTALRDLELLKAVILPKQ